MSTLLLDTNIVSYFTNGHSLADSYREFVAGQTLAISFMTVAEMFEGAHRANWSERRIAILEEAFHDYLVVPSSYAACKYWGMVRNARRRTPISPEDAWIAATALSLSCPLVTHDSRGFEGISGLKVLSIER